ncbi:MAG TPA: glutamine amidotransferase [Candidatus Sulfotelmatobacter sp.]|nr:glutamine amidotransferase [Candidatus Sulfotelmatobacter sp.]
MLPHADNIFLAMIQWHPRLSGIWCGVIVFAAAAWLFFLHRRLARRVSPGRARWLLLPKVLTVLALLFVLFNPVSAMQKNEQVKGKLLVLVDSSSSMDVADDYHYSRLTRARKIVESWKRALPRAVQIDELEFDTAIHKPGENSQPGLRGTDLGGCLLALSERNDMDSYLGVALLTDGGDEVLENPALPGAPLYIIGIGADPATWNDVAIAGLDCPPTAEKDVAFEIGADIQARAGHGGNFAQELTHVRVLLEHATGRNSWETIGNQTVDLSNLRRLVRLPVKCSEPGIQRYRVSIVPVAGELSPLNNTRVVTVNVQKKSLRVLFFAEELGQEFKVLRNELAHDPGIAFTALIRTTGNQFELQGDRLPGDDTLAAGFPATKSALEPYDAVILGSFPAIDFSPQQMEALVEFCQAGGTVIFLGGDASFGRGGYAATPLAALLPWQISDREPEEARGAFPVGVAPMGAGNPILATVDDIVTGGSATLDALNQVDELKPGATELLDARVGDHELPVIATQRFGQGKVMAVASSTLWKWAMAPEPLGSAYGLLWRQAVRELTGKAEGGQNLAVRWDKDFYLPGEMAAGQIHALGADAQTLQFMATLAVKNQSAPVSVEPVPGQPQTFQVKFRFRERGDYDFRLVAFQGGRELETYEKNFPVAPLLPEGSRLEVDELGLKKLAESGGGAYFREDEAKQLPARLTKINSHQVTVEESSLAEAGPWFLLAFLSVLVFEWILRRRLNLF